jgi:hypothetical protein
LDAERASSRHVRRPHHESAACSRPDGMSRAPGPQNETWRTRVSKIENQINRRREGDDGSRRDHELGGGEGRASCHAEGHEHRSPRLPGPLRRRSAAEPQPSYVHEQGHRPQEVEAEPESGRSSSSQHSSVGGPGSLRAWHAAAWSHSHVPRPRRGGAGPRVRPEASRPQAVFEEARTRTCEITQPLKRSGEASKAP